MNAPALAGQSDWYLVKSINDFRQGVRGSQPDDIYGIQMQAAVTLLDDDAAVRDVVAYIQSFEPDALGVRYTNSIRYRGTHYEYFTS